MSVSLSLKISLTAKTNSSCFLVKIAEIGEDGDYFFLYFHKPVIQDLNTINKYYKPFAIRYV